MREIKKSIETSINRGRNLPDEISAYTTSIFGVIERRKSRENQSKRRRKKMKKISRNSIFIMKEINRENPPAIEEKWNTRLKIEIENQNQSGMAKSKINRPSGEEEINNWQLQCEKAPAWKAKISMKRKLPKKKKKSKINQEGIVAHRNPAINIYQKSSIRKIENRTKSIIRKSMKWPTSINRKPYEIDVIESANSAFATPPSSKKMLKSHQPLKNGTKKPAGGTAQEEEIIWPKKKWSGSASKEIRRKKYQSKEEERNENDERRKSHRKKMKYMATSK